MVKIQCLIHGHDFRWEFGVADIKHCTGSSCSIFTKCSRCGKLSLMSYPRTHQFGEWTPELHEKCTLIRTCVYCGWTEKKVQHGEMSLVKGKTPCKYQHTCKDCGAVIGETWRHGSTHVVNTDNPCIQHAVCDQCGKVAQEIDHHAYGQSYMGGFYSEGDSWTKQVTCKRCGYTKVL